MQMSWNITSVYQLAVCRHSVGRWCWRSKKKKTKASGSDLLILAPLGTNHGRHWPKSLKATGQIKEEIPPRIFQSSRPSCSLGIEILVLCKFLSADHIRIANRSGRSDARYMQISAGTETESETNISETCEAMCARKTWSEVIAPIHVILSSVGGKVCRSRVFGSRPRGGRWTCDKLTFSGDRRVAANRTGLPVRYVPAAPDWRVHSAQGRSEIKTAKKVRLELWFRCKTNKKLPFLYAMWQLFPTRWSAVISIQDFAEDLSKYALHIWQQLFNFD